MHGNYPRLIFGAIDLQCMAPLYEWQTVLPLAALSIFFSSMFLTIESPMTSVFFSVFLGWFGC
jgi:hypothetical protein